MSVDVDCIVAGAGVVGLAIARSLAQGGKEVIVLDRSESIGSETSSRNSEVIHAGIYYPQNCLKSMLCIRGRDLLYKYCAQKHIAHRRTGKLIVATDASDVGRLKKLQVHAASCGVGTEQIPRQEVAKMEPEISCEGALWSPMTGIVDSHELMLRILADLEAAGGIVVLQTEVRKVVADPAHISVETIDSTIACRQFVNAAGLGAQDLAKSTAGLAGEHIPPAFLAIGHYYSLVGSSPFQHLIYPLPTDDGLGVHVTIDLADQVRFGPDVRWIKEVNYQFDDSRREEFRGAIRRYYPGIDDRELTPGFTGIRPRVVGPGEAAGDFVISGQKHHGISGLVNLFGIESPGLTASLAIGEYVSQLLQ